MFLYSLTLVKVLAKGVVFDMDGVLIDSMPYYAQTWQIMLGKHGIKASHEELREHFGSTTRNSLAMVKKQFNFQCDDEAFIKEKVALSRKLVPEKAVAFDGAAELMALLKEAGLKVAIASSAPRDLIEIVTQKFELIKYVDFYIGGNQVKNSKPHPEIFARAAEGVSLKPDECVAVEDSILGIKSAKAAGLKCIAVATSFEQGLLKEADLIVESIKELTVERIHSLG